MRLILTTEDQLDIMITNAVEKALSAMKPMEEKPVWRSPEQVCKQLGIDRSTLWRWTRENYLPGTKFGNRIRYRQSDVERLAEVSQK